MLACVRAVLHMLLAALRRAVRVCARAHARALVRRTQRAGKGGHEKRVREHEFLPVLLYSTWERKRPRDVIAHPMLARREGGAPRGG